MLETSHRWIRRAGRGGWVLVLVLWVAAWGAFGSEPEQPYLLVLGVAQDGGYPQAGTKSSPAWDDPSLRRLVVSLGLVDPARDRRYLFEATPDFKEQLHRLDVAAPVTAPDRGRPGLDGIFLTHGHMGHYTGLIHLGREALGASGVPVYAMPRMATFLRQNGPWELLVRLGNIEIRDLEAERTVRLGEDLAVTPILVPHRDEYTETVGFRIVGPNRSVFFLPDIDKWETWDDWEQEGGARRIEEVIASVDVAYLDGTFFADGEIPGRAMSEIPHPFIRESLARLADLPAAEKAKVRFIHLNRTNPAIVPGSDALREIEAAGFRVAVEGERVEL